VQQQPLNTPQYAASPLDAQQRGRWMVGQRSPRLAGQPLQPTSGSAALVKGFADLRDWEELSREQGRLCEERHGHSPKLVGFMH